MTDETTTIDQALYEELRHLRGCPAAHHPLPPAVIGDEPTALEAFDYASGGVSARILRCTRCGAQEVHKFGAAAG